MDIMLIFVFVISAFLGVELISKVPSQLHTPLMSVTNAISGIILLGAISQVGNADTRIAAVAFVAIVLATSTSSADSESRTACCACLTRKENKPSWIHYNLQSVLCSPSAYSQASR